MRTESHSGRVNPGRSNWRLSIRYAILHAATLHICRILFNRWFAGFTKVYLWLILTTWIFYSQGPPLLFQNAAGSGRSDTGRMKRDRSERGDPADAVAASLATKKSPVVKSVIALDSLSAITA